MRRAAFRGRVSSVAMARSVVRVRSVVKSCAKRSRCFSLFSGETKKFSGNLQRRKLRLPVYEHTSRRAANNDRPVVMGMKRCSHGKRKDRCKECNPCPHGKVKERCAECNPCPHGKLKANCAACTPRKRCPNGKQKGSCVACKPCPHGKLSRAARSVTPAPTASERAGARSAKRHARIHQVRNGSSARRRVRPRSNKSPKSDKSPSRSPSAVTSASANKCTSWKARTITTWWGE